MEEFSKSETEQTANGSTVRPHLVQPTSGALETSVTNVLRDALDRSLSEFGHSHAVAQATAVVTDRVHGALVSELRATNRRRSPILRVPNEISCMIWSLLDLRDKIAVTHVCADWRTVALGTPTLWRTLEGYSSRREPSPTPHYHDHWALSRSFDVGHEPDAHSSTLHLVRHVLGRSRRLALSVTIHLGRNWSDRSGLNRLAASLYVERARLAALTFDLNFVDGFMGPGTRGSVLAGFLGSLVELPKLRLLRTNDLLPHQSYSGLLLPSLRLPTLTRVSLPGVFVQEYNNPALQFPSVRQAQCTYLDTASFASFIRLFPELHNLDVYIARDVGSRQMDLGEPEAKLRALVSAIPAVHLHDLSLASEGVALAVFHDRSRAEFSLHYRPDVASGRAFRVFEDVQLAREVKCLVNEAVGEASTLMADDGVRRRIVVCSLGVHCHYYLATQMWPKLGPKFITTVMVDVRMWAALIVGLPAAPQLRQVIVRVPSNIDFEYEKADFIPVPQCETAEYPALVLIQFNGNRHHDFPVISASSLCDLLRCVGFHNSQYLTTNIAYMTVRGKFESDICGGRMTVTYRIPGPSAD
ncbi:hypothetical protein AURDEDRAFT_126267 [Auricularia subglabra TFB-10046 SS5]|nr:hypothetical protein AURDEDRAFT_126267 [Auricularia subglabra TFB-10046 SS5]